jgi:molybdopterin converting factor subunit 1
LNVKVKFFASYKEALGMEELALELKEGTDVNSLLDILRKDHPKLGNLLETLVVSINLEYASFETELKDGDEVALLPPVSGG